MKIGKTVLKYYLYFGLIVIILLLGLGVILLLSNYFPYIPTNMRNILGIFIISYGAFRLVNIIQKFKNQDYDNDEVE